MTDTATIIPINDLLWTQTRYSDVLGMDRRVVASALETAPSQMHSGTRVWHVRDGMPAIFKRGQGGKIDFETLAPKDRLDFIRSQRELLKLKQETKTLLPAVDVERHVGEMLKILAQGLAALPDVLERECGLTPAGITAAHRTLDAARETLYAAVVTLLEKPD